MEELTSVLERATAAIEPDYFLLSIHGGKPVYRERVYCYELYHQMRLLWPQDCAFRLNGEVDKMKHPILAGLGADGYKPDLLVHTPGNMNGNHAVIEVKPAQYAHSGFAKDLGTLTVFRERVGYERAIYLVYGNVDDALVNRIADGAAKLRINTEIELWLHAGAGQQAFLAFVI